MGAVVGFVRNQFPVFDQTDDRYFFHLEGDGVVTFVVRRDEVGGGETVSDNYLWFNINLIELDGLSSDDFEVLTEPPGDSFINGHPYYMEPGQTEFEYRIRIVDDSVSEEEALGRLQLQLSITDVLPVDERHVLADQFNQHDELSPLAYLRIFDDDQDNPPPLVPPSSDGEGFPTYSITPGPSVVEGSGEDLEWTISFQGSWTYVSGSGNRNRIEYEIIDQSTGGIVKSGGFGKNGVDDGDTKVLDFTPVDDAEYRGNVTYLLRITETNLLSGPTGTVSSGLVIDDESPSEAQPLPDPDELPDETEVPDSGILPEDVEPHRAFFENQIVQVGIELFAGVVSQSVGLSSLGQTLEAFGLLDQDFLDEITWLAGTPALAAEVPPLTEIEIEVMKAYRQMSWNVPEQNPSEYFSIAWTYAEADRLFQLHLRPGDFVDNRLVVNQPLIGVDEDNNPFSFSSVQGRFNGSNSDMTSHKGSIDHSFDWGGRAYHGIDVYVVAPIDGTVVGLRSNLRNEPDNSLGGSGLGNFVTILANDRLPDGSPLYITLAHLMQDTTQYEINDTVTAGTVVGEMGATGQGKKHLHMQVGNFLENGLANADGDLEIPDAYMIFGSANIASVQDTYPNRSTNLDQDVGFPIGDTALNDAGQALEAIVVDQILPTFSVEEMLNSIAAYREVLSGEPEQEQVGEGNANGDGALATISLDNVSALSTSQFLELAELYAAYFNRAPDAEGLAFWANAYGSGISLEEISEYFFDQDEVRELYPDGQGITEFVTDVYRNVFGREPDSEGSVFWENVLNLGDVTVGSFVREVLAGAKSNEDQADAEYIDVKTNLGLQFAAASGLNDVDAAKVVFQTLGPQESTNLTEALNVIAAQAPSENLLLDDNILQFMAQEVPVTFATGEQDDHSRPVSGTPEAVTGSTLDLSSSTVENWVSLMEGHAPHLHTGDAVGVDVSLYDAIIGGSERDTFNGDGNANRLSGEQGADRLFGNGGNDTLFGGDGADYLNGGPGEDHLYGGAGNDSFLVGGGATGHDLIFDFDLAEDRISFVDPSDGAVPLSVDHAGGDTRVFFQGYSETSVTLVGLVAEVGDISVSVI